MNAIIGLLRNKIKTIKALKSMLKTIFYDFQHDIWSKKDSLLTGRVSKT